jgi:N-methylhydantoinase A
VGPQSAGADPGPVCYGRGGTHPTITDCNLVLGYLDPAGLAGGAMRLDADAARHAVATQLAAPLGTTVEQAAHGMLRLAAATMMRAIRAVSVERGRDPRDFALLAFGGNGPLFAAAIAADIGIARVIVPPMPGLFSALGLLLADTEHHAGRSLRMRLDAADAALLDQVFGDLAAQGMDRLAQDGFPPARRTLRLSAMARYVGQSSDIAVALPDGDAAAVLAALPNLFAVEHDRTYGFRAPPDEPIEITAVSVVAAGIPERPRLPDAIPPIAGPPQAPRRVWLPDGGWIEVSVLRRIDLSAKPRQGPVIVQEYDAACLVPHGWQVSLDAFGNIVLTIS